MKPIILSILSIFIFSSGLQETKACSRFVYKLFEQGESEHRSPTHPKIPVKFIYIDGATKSTATHTLDILLKNESMEDMANFQESNSLVFKKDTELLFWQGEFQIKKRIRFLLYTQLSDKGESRFDFDVSAPAQGRVRKIRLLFKNDPGAFSIKKIRTDIFEPKVELVGYYLSHSASFYQKKDEIPCELMRKENPLLFLTLQSSANQNKKIVFDWRGGALTEEFKTRNISFEDTSKPRKYLVGKKPSWVKRRRTRTNP